MNQVEQPRYRLRFFFDPGSGVCLWSGNEEARVRFDYPILPEVLPLSASTKHALESLVDRFESAVDMSDPGEPAWGHEEASLFNAEVDRVLALVESELGPEFRIKREQLPIRGQG